MGNNFNPKTIRARLESLCAEASQLIPENKRCQWVNYLEGHLNHYMSVLSRLPEPESCGRLLEVGCTPGHLSLLLVDLGYKVDCVDIAPDRLAQMWSAYTIKVHKVDIENERLPFEDKSFSIVLFTEVLEHLRVNPIFTLREIARVTETGGKIILSAPNITPSQRFKFLMGRDYQGDIIKAFEQLSTVGHTGHVRLYSAKEIGQILTYVGYNNLKFSREGKLRGSIFWRMFFPWRNYFKTNIYFVGTHVK